MLRRKQNDFDSFCCIADRCPDNCCRGWQIVIDDKSLEGYSSYKGEFSQELMAGIDKDNGLFRQKGSSCSMLMDNGLCRLQSTLGEDYLCDTCRLYPRHIEEFPDIREYSLSLSCPEVVRMVFKAGDHLGFTETEDEEDDDCDDYGDFDYFLFDKLGFQREQMLALLRKDDICLEERMDMIAKAAFKLQAMYDYGDLASMDQIDYNEALEKREGRRNGYIFSHDYMIESFSLLMELEEMHSSWREILESTLSYWKCHKDHSDEWGSAMYPKGRRKLICERILESLLYTYFCGSIYDGQIYARAMLCIYTLRWVMMIGEADGGPGPEEAMYIFSREAEHSDNNLNKIIGWYEDEL